MFKPKGPVSDIVAKIAQDRGAPPKAGDAPGPTPSPDDDASESDMGLEACGEDVLSAMKQGDPKGFTSALKTFIDMYKGSDDDDSGAESDEGE